MEHHVPVLDLERFDTDGERFIRELGGAYREYGFCGFLNHGISRELTRQAYRVFKQFFALPEEIKSRYAADAGGQRGYTAFGIEQAKDHGVPDLKEFWHVGREMPPDNPWPKILEPNVWPAEVPGFRANAYGLYQDLDALGNRILKAIALSLGLNESWFTDKVFLGNSVLRAIHYPPVRDKSTRAVRAARHEDINLITLLLGSDEAGLQILARDGSWVPVTTIPDTIVVNIGDMLQRLTNHMLPSTPHRVMNPPGAGSHESRYSIPFFFHPNPDFVIKTLPECISAENPNRYPQSITANEFLVNRLREIKLM